MGLQSTNLNKIHLERLNTYAKISTTTITIPKAATVTLQYAVVGRSATRHATLPTVKHL